METTFSININDYLSAGEIEDMVRDEVRYQICDKVDRILKHTSISDIIKYTASEIVMQTLEEQDMDLHQKMADKVLECIDELSLYYVLRNDDNDNKSKGQLVLDECVEEAKPKVKQKLDSIIEDKLDADWLVDMVVDDFYNRLREQIISR